MAVDMPKIVRHKGILGGKPIIEGTRISVDLIMHYIVNRMKIEDIKNDYPFLSERQIKAAIDYADKSLHKAEGDLESQIS